MVERIVLFDGVCNLCNHSVQFILQRDPEAQFRFASLQSEAGKKLLAEHDQRFDLQTIVLIEDGQAYQRSTAALRICRNLKGGWPLLYGGIILPRFLRDALYNFIARNRYRWFGKSDECLLPTPEFSARFLDQ